MSALRPRGHLFHYLAAWSVHLFTASAACLGVFTLVQIYQHHYIQALYLMALTVLIDGVDGGLARRLRVKDILPQMDGALLDNIVDYLNYVITPCVFLLVKPGMLVQEVAVLTVVVITLTSAYQFCQAEAKTPDHFFKGFPCYWNITVFYMFLLNTSALVNTLVLVLFAVFIFIPIKYVYPSRLDCLTRSKAMKRVMHGCSVLYGVSSLFLLINYPKIDTLWIGISFAYVLMYFLLSFYRTCFPLQGVLLCD